MGHHRRTKTVTGTLLTIEQEVQKAAITHPAIILVGQVVSTKRKLEWINETYDDVGTALMFSLMISSYVRISSLYQVSTNRGTVRDH